MVSKDDFQVVEREDGTFSVVGCGYDQFVDFENFGKPIATAERAKEVCSILVDIINNPPERPLTPEEKKLAELEAENKALKVQLESTASAIDFILMNFAPMG